MFGNIIFKITANKLIKSKTILNNWCNNIWLSMEKIDCGFLSQIIYENQLQIDVGLKSEKENFTLKTYRGIFL